MTARSTDDLRAKIREVPDFPKPGILFYDITTLLREAEAFKDVIDRMSALECGSDKVGQLIAQTPH